MDGVEKKINGSTVDLQEVTALWEGPTSRLTVTGECGDQIFGSQLLEVESGMVLGGVGSVLDGEVLLGEKENKK